MLLHDDEDQPLLNGAAVQGREPPLLRLLLVDSYASIRQPLARVLGQQPGLVVAGDVGSPDEALRLAALEELDLVLIGIELGENDAIQLIRDLRTTYPSLKLLVLTPSKDRYRHASVVEAGADGVLHRSVTYHKVLSTIRQLGSGKRLVSPQEAVALHTLVNERRHRDRVAKQAINSLTRREVEVLQVMSEGLSDAAIAASLGIDTDTARKHVLHVRTKLGVDSKLKAVLFALRHGVIRIDDSGSCS